MWIRPNYCAETPMGRDETAPEAENGERPETPERPEDWTREQSGYRERYSPSRYDPHECNAECGVCGAELKSVGSARGGITWCAAEGVLVQQW
jgi:hypothetical protein